MCIEESLLVLNRSRRVHLLYKLIGLNEIRTVTSLVSKAPYDDGRVIEVSLHHPAHSFEMSLSV